MPLEPDRLGPVRHEHLLVALGERDHRDPRQVVRLHRLDRCRQLALPSVDHHEVGRQREAFVVLLLRRRPDTGEPPRDGLGERRVVVLAVHPADAELPVVRLLRCRVLEDHHRRDRRLLLDVRDVEALDPEREALEVEHLAELLQRLDPAQPRLLRLRGVGLERKPRVLVRELLQPTLLAPLGAADLHTRATAFGEELGQRGRVPRLARDDDLRRDRRRRAVVLEHERLQQRRNVLPLDVLEVEGVAVDHLPVAEREDLHCRARPLDRDPDDVHGATARLSAACRSARCRRRRAGSGTAPPPRTARPRRLRHPALQLADDRPRLSGQELDHAVDHLPVVLLRDVVHARREAAVDVEVEARDPRVATRLRALARTEPEDAIEDVQRLAHLLRVRVRAEVDDPAAVPLAREHHPRVVVVHGHRDVRERLVVAQPDVERRPVALDEVLLEVQRLDLGPGDDHLEVGDPRDHPADPRPGVAALLEVAPHARPERLRLADVEDLLVRVAEQVDARLRGDGKGGITLRNRLGEGSPRACRCSGAGGRRERGGEGESLWENQIRHREPERGGRRAGAGGGDEESAGSRGAGSGDPRPGRPRNGERGARGEIGDADRPSTGGTTPNTAELRAEFAAYVATIARRPPNSATSSSGTSRTSTASGCPSSGRTAKTWPRPPTSRCSRRRMTP